MPKLSKKDSSPEENRPEERSKYELANKTDSRYIKLGFNYVTKPEEDMPTMPDKMSNINSQELGNYMSTYAAWREYTEEVLMQAVMDYLLIEEKYDLEYKKSWLTTPKTSTVKDKEYEIETLSFFVDLRRELTEASLYKQMIEAKYNSINNAISTLSREITRRQDKKYEN